MASSTRPTASALRPALRTRAARLAASATVVGAMLAGCSAAESPDLAASSSENVAPIIRGATSSADQDAVVLLSITNGNGQVVAGCTATLIAPNLVITARHCVSATDDNGNVTRDYAAGQLYVTTGVNAGASNPPAVTARGTQVFRDTATSINGNDVSLILLDQKIPGAKIAPIRLDAPAVAGEMVTAIGWGYTESGQSPDQRRQRPNVPVQSVGLTQGAGSAATELVIGEAACSGDSGGPILSAKGAVLGIASRVGNGADPVPGTANFCVNGNGLQAIGIYGSPSAHKALIMTAFQGAGATPWLEGQGDPRLAKFGDKCAADGDCQSGVCVSQLNGERTCSQSCVADACPTGYACTDAAGGKRICTVALPATPDAGAKPVTDAGASTPPSTDDDDTTTTGTDAGKKKKKKASTSANSKDDSEDDEDTTKVPAYARAPGGAVACTFGPTSSRGGPGLAGFGALMAVAVAVGRGRRRKP
ncbi:MAG: trypsin-like serine protease [Polyangiaceae bacterium]